MLKVVVFFCNIDKFFVKNQMYYLCIKCIIMMFIIYCKFLYLGICMCLVIIGYYGIDNLVIIGYYCIDNLVKQ